MNHLRVRGSHIKRNKLIAIVLLAVCAASALALPVYRRVQAQAATTAPTPMLQGQVAQEVNKEGYHLIPHGLAMDSWPNPRFNFSITHNDPSSGKSIPFNGLRAADIRVQLDGGQEFTPKDSDLKLTGSDPASVLLLLDGSGSMVDSHLGVNKLSAAKKALNTFIDSLGERDVAAFAAFDDSPRIITQPTSNKSVLHSDINNFTLRPGHSAYTRLYDAVDFALRQAHDNKLRHIVVISDGWEDSPESQKLTSPTQLSDFKHQRTFAYSR